MASLIGLIRHVHEKHGRGLKESHDLVKRWRSARRCKLCRFRLPEAQAIEKAKNGWELVHGLFEIHWQDGVADQVAVYGIIFIASPRSRSKTK